MTLTVNNVNVVQGRITIPKWGVWTAEVNLDEPLELSGAVTIKELDAELRGTVVSGGISGGRSSYCIVGGAGGWRKDVPEKGYQNAAGCTFSSIVSELASEVGETLEDAPRTVLGSHYSRSKGKAVDTLVQHMPGAWHVGDDGITRFKPRKSYEYKEESSAIEAPNDSGMIRVSANYGYLFRPGVKVSGTTIGDVDLFYGPRRVVAYCYPETASTGLIGLIVQRATAGAKYFGCYEYKCNDCDSAYLLNLEPVDSTLGLPNLEKVPMRPMAGWQSKVEGGTVVLSFLNGNPGKPIVLGCAEADENDSTLVVLGNAGSADFVALGGLVDDVVSTFKDAISAAFAAVGASTAANGVLGQQSFDAATAAIQSVAAQNVKAS